MVFVGCTVSQFAAVFVSAVSSHQAKDRSSSRNLILIYSLKLIACPLSQKLSTCVTFIAIHPPHVVIYR